MIEVTDYMVDYVNGIMDEGEYDKHEIKAFENIESFAAYIYEGDFKELLSDIESAKVYDENLSLLDNLFYEYHGMFQDESYEYVYYIL